MSELHQDLLDYMVDETPHDTKNVIQTERGAIKFYQVPQVNLMHNKI